MAQIALGIVTTLSVLPGNQIEVVNTHSAQEEAPIIVLSDRNSMKEYVLQRLQEEGIDTQIAGTVINCESGWNPNAIGDHGQSLGLWQIHLPAHPSITASQAFDPVVSTEYAIQLIKKSGWYPWSCWKNIYLK